MTVTVHPIAEARDAETQAATGTCRGEQSCVAGNSSRVGAVWTSLGKEQCSPWLQPRLRAPRLHPLQLKWVQLCSSLAQQPCQHTLPVHREERPVAACPVSRWAQIIPLMNWLLRSYSCCIYVTIKATNTNHPLTCANPSIHPSVTSSGCESMSELGCFRRRLAGLEGSRMPGCMGALPLLLPRKDRDKQLSQGWRNWLSCVSLVIGVSSMIRGSACAGRGRGSGPELSKAKA